MMSLLLPLLVSAMVFGFVVYLGYVVVLRREDAAKRRSLAMVAGYASQDVSGALAQARREDSLIRTTLLALGNRMTTHKQKARLAQQALFAGRNDPAAAEDVVVRKVVFLLVGLLLGLILAMGEGGSWWLAIPVLGLAGFFIPDLLLYNTGIKRSEVMGKTLPDALDLLNLCVESGLSFQAAMTQVAANQQGPVGEEFGVALQEMQFGRSRAQALSSLAQRTRQEDVKRFVSAMLQVDKIGVPVATVLREQAREMRAKRYSRAREQAQKVPVKILMPLMLCFLPAIFVVILGPAAYSIYQVFTQQI